MPKLWDIFGGKKKPTVRELLEQVIELQVRTLEALETSMQDLASLAKLAVQSEAVTVRLEKVAAKLKAMDEAQ